MITTEAPQGTAGANGKRRWFELGLVSAGAAAPLIARWRSLRAADQAEALREQASDRLNDALAWVAQSRPQAQEALQQAQDAIQQALPQAQESLRQVGEAARSALQRRPSRRSATTLWLVGVGVGMVAAGAVAYIVLRNRINPAADDDELVEIPLTAAAAAVAVDGDGMGQPFAAAASASDGPAITEEPPDDEPGVVEPLEFSEEDAEGAVYVGNILSRVYHPLDSNRLPAPQHRIYFASAEQAHAAGYRPDSAELTAHAPDSNAGQPQ